MPLGITLWRSHGGGDSVVPADGCTDLIVRGDEVVVAGPSTRWIATNGDNEHGSIGLRLPAGFAGAVLRTSAVDLTDRAVPLGHVVSKSTTAELQNAMLKADCSSDLLDAISTVVLARVIESRPRLTHIWRAAQRTASAGAVAAELGESGRTFRRRMLTEFGYGYATLVRIERTASARQLLARGATAVEASTVAGFADQSHLTREFRRMVGLTPAQFAASSA